MDDKIICSSFEACLQFIYLKLDYYKKILDDEQLACENTITIIREQACLYNNDNDQIRAITGFNTIELANQLDYFEQEAFKTYEENKTCLFKMFQNLLKLHHEYAFNEVLLNERQIAESFQYHPSILPNIKRISFVKQVNRPSTSLSMNSVIINTDKPHLTFSATPTPKTSVQSTSFSKRADIDAFQQKHEYMQSKPMEKVQTSIESNEIDLTKLIRDTYQNNTGEQFTFSKISQNWQQQQQNTKITSVKKVLKPTISCDDALLSAANKRFVLLYNMNTSNILYVFDTQKDETKEFHWDEGEIYSLGHADSNLFYIITSTKIILYDIIKEKFDNQYFLYDTLYKDLLLITDDLSYKTSLKRNNQIQSTVFEEFCYYLYTNKEYEQILIKCSLETFHHESIINLTKKYPDIQYFLDLTVTSKSVVTFLIQDNHGYHLYFCNELQNYNLRKKLSISNAYYPTKLVTTVSPDSLRYRLSTTKNKINEQLWFILDEKSNCIHCFTEEKYLTKITSTTKKLIQSLTIFENKLILAYSELTVDIIDLDNYFSSFKL